MLLGLRNYTPDKWKKISVWTFAGGRMEPEETIEEALRREVKEETGITNFEIHDIFAQLDGAREGDVIILFYCTTTEEPKLMEPEKFSEWRWVEFSEYIKNEEFKKINPIAHLVVSFYLQLQYDLSIWIGFLIA